MTYKVLDLFSGAGGFSCGFEQAGFKTIGAIEFDKQAAQTFKENHKDAKVFIDDIRNLHPEDIEDKIGIPDVIIGGPPCQGFSVAGKRDLNDQRNTLPLEYIRFIKHFKPKIFVLENVKGMISMDKGNLLKFFIQEFEKLGYTVQSKLVEAIKHEVPQLRERLFIVGVRNDIDISFSYPQELNSYLTLEDAIGDIEETGTFEEVGVHNHDMCFPVDDTIYFKLMEGKFLCDVRHGQDHVHSWEIELKGECSSKELDILNAISENRRKKKYGPKDGNPLLEETIQSLTGYDDIKEELTKLVKSEYLEKIGDKYDIHDRKVSAGLRRFHRNNPVNTITTQSGKNSPYAHYSQPRNFTVREVARLQTFPDEFIFKGSIPAQYRQVGNAVPPKLGEKIGEQINELLNHLMNKINK